MLHHTEIIFDLPEGLNAGDGAVAHWSGEHDLGAVDYARPLLVARVAVFRDKRQAQGKGTTGHGVFSKTGAVTSVDRAGKGARPKGGGPKGSSRQRARVTVLVPPMFGQREFALKLFDAQGNVSGSTPATVLATVSAVPPQPGPAVYDGFAGGAVTIKTSERRR